MNRSEVIDLVFRVATASGAFDRLEEALAESSVDEIDSALAECGILPEVFDHDSSEEKLWAKYSDIALSAALTRIGIESAVMRTRGDSADVFGKTSAYTMVGDAKTFRLSRSAKNQKDFKIKALDDWRRENDYAVLVGPLNQFPSSRSQIYHQATEHNVTLLSYMHVRLLMRHAPSPLPDLSPLWRIGSTRAGSVKRRDWRVAETYWRAVDQTVVNLLCLAPGDIQRAKADDHRRTIELGREGITYWEAKIEAYNALSKDEAIQLLIRSEKIAQKIDQIRRAMDRECSL